MRPFRVGNFVRASVSAACLSVLIASGAMAQASPEIRKFQMLIDAKGARVAPIDRVRTAADGSVESVSVIYNMDYLTIPGNTLSVKGDRVVQSTLTRDQMTELGSKKKAR